MLVWLIIFLLAIALGYVVGSPSDEGGWFAFCFGFWGCILGFVASVLIGCGVHSDKEWRKVDSKPLMNIADNQDTEGHFGFLLGGTVDGQPVYSWYEQTAENTFVRRDVDAWQAEIHYTEGEPHYDSYEQFHTADPSFIKLWVFNPNGPKPDETHDAYTHYDFYVPRGSIIPEYKLDAK